MKTALKLATALAQEIESLYDNLPFHVVIDDEEGVVEEVDDHRLANEVYYIRQLSYEILTKLEELS